MIDSSKRYPSKVLLFGEYSVVKGGSALAVPYSRLSVCFSKKEKIDLNFQKPLDYWKEQHIELDYDQLESDLSDGWGIESSIPVGSGLGSSGAVVAAVYDTYGLNKTTDAIILKDTFAKMESFFHGKSSGFDPLISYLQKPIAIRDGNILQKDRIKIPSKIFLWNSGIKRETGGLVPVFLKNLEAPAFEELFSGEYSRLNEQLIDTVWKEQALENEKISRLSELQIQLFDEMIPDKVKDIWKRGLESGAYAMKLCGAGGGGFFIISEFKEGSVKDTFSDLFRLDSFISKAGNINLPLG